MIRGVAVEFSDVPEEFHKFRRLTQSMCDSRAVRDAYDVKGNLYVLRFSLKFKHARTCLLELHLGN